MADAAALGRPADGGILVADVAQANRLHNKSAVGRPTSANGLLLTPVEAAWCVATGKLTVANERGTGLGWTDLLADAARRQRAEVEYLAYRDLRERGLVARPAAGEGRFDVWPRGKGTGPAQFQVLASAERDGAPAAQLLAGATAGLVAAVIDEDGAATHYVLALEEPAGHIADAPVPKATGRLLADRVAVEAGPATAAYAQQAIGLKHESGAVLSLLEAAALQRRGTLAVDGDLAAAARRAHDDFDARLAVYADLRRRGVAAKSGFRFGTHLRGYRSDPDDEHAEWLLHCAAPDATLAWSDLSRGVRLAHGVRKKFLVAIAAPTGVRYVHVAWFRP